MRAKDVSNCLKKAQDATVVHCPFCGATQGADNAHWWGVRCRNCGATGPCHPPRDEKGYSQEVDAAFDPIAAWNQRVPTDSEVETREELTAANDTLAAYREQEDEWIESDNKTQAELTALRALRVEADAIHEALTHYGRDDMASIGQIHGWRERLRRALDKCKEAELSAPGDPCVGCQATNHCPIQNPCPIKQVWLEGRRQQ